MDPAHIPALLGTALVLAFIVLGSLALRMAARLARRRSRAAMRDPVAASAYADAQLVPDTTAEPAMPARAQRRAVRNRPRARGSRKEAVSAPPRDTAPILAQEASLRGLLRRLQAADLAAKPASDGSIAATHAPAPVVPEREAPPLALGDLEAALAVWCAKRAAEHVEDPDRAPGQTYQRDWRSR